jgi:uncharacterized membrane protein
MSSGGPMVSGDYSEKDINDGKPLAAVGYVPLCCIPTFLVPMMMAKENAYAQYHARQGAVLYIVAVLGAIVLVVFQTVCGFIGHGLGCISNLVGLGYGGVVLVVMVLGIINALQGQAKELPVIGQFAAKLPF